MGMQYNYFRDYDPGIGRYVQSDPIGLRGGLNTYGYVGARPLTHIDDDGLEAVLPNPARPFPGHGSGSIGLGSGVLGACRLLSLGIGLALYSGNGDACSDDPARKRDECKALDCDREWREARQVCRDLIYEQMQQQAGRRKKRSVTGVTGGYTDVEECARGLVSEACGGNKVRR